MNKQNALMSSSKRAQQKSTQPDGSSVCGQCAPGEQRTALWGRPNLICSRKVEEMEMRMEGLHHCHTLTEYP